jgi:hypothetical protein
MLEYRLGALRGGCRISTLLRKPPFPYNGIPRWPTNWGMCKLTRRSVCKCIILKETWKRDQIELKHLHVSGHGRLTIAPPVCVHVCVSYQRCISLAFSGILA